MPQSDPCKKMWGLARQLSDTVVAANLETDCKVKLEKLAAGIAQYKFMYETMTSPANLNCELVYAIEGLQVPESCCE